MGEFFHCFLGFSVFVLFLFVFLKVKLPSLYVLQDYNRVIFKISGETKSPLSVCYFEVSQALLLLFFTKCDCLGSVVFLFCGKKHIHALTPPHLFSGTKQRTLNVTKAPARFYSWLMRNC